MAAKQTKSSGGRVTPKGGSSPASPRSSSRSRAVNWVAVVLVVLILAGLIAGAVGVALLGGPVTTTTTQAMREGAG